MTSYYSEDELRKLNFKHLGINCKISKLCSLYNTSCISIGDNTRIDDFCVLSAGVGGIYIGDYVHISTHVTICGKSKITICDYSCVSFKSTITSNCDDFSGLFMANPTIPIYLTNVLSKDIYISKHVIIGAYCFIMPGVYICENVSIGAYSFVKKHIQRSGIYFGNPLKFYKEKSDKCIILENQIRK